MPPPELVTSISAWSLQNRHRAARSRELQPAPEVNSLWIDVIPLGNVYPQLEASIRRIQELAALQRNWDSYGSARIQEGALSGALRVLKTLDFGELPAPSISAVPGGGLQFEWTSPKARSLELEFEPDGTVTYLVERGEEEALEGSLPGDRLDEVRALIRLFLNEQ